MERKIRNQNGITIISLVITIIAMIIIASISIKMGLSSIKSAQDTTIETNLEIVQQAVTQQYSKAKTLNNLDVEADMTLEMEEIKKQQPSSFIGTPLEKDKLKERVEKLPNVPDLINVDNTYTYEDTNYEDMYYLVSGTELKELGIDVGDGQEYIVNYSTGEVLDVTNESFTSGDPAYINGFTTVLDVEDEAFVDTPIHISINEELTKTPTGYKFSIKVIDEVAKITPEGVPEGTKPTQTHVENDPDDLNKNDIINENIIITGVDPDNPITDGVTIVKKVVPDPDQGIEEHYIYEIVIDDTKVDPTNPVIKIEILPDSVIDDEDNGNAITELTTSDQSVDVEEVQFDFTLANLKYFAKDMAGNLIDGVKNIHNEEWGYSASLDLILSTNEKRGLNKQTYVFDYIWTTDTNLDWSSAKQVSLAIGQGEKSAKTNIYLEGYSGKGTLYVRPSSNMQSAAGSSLGETSIKTMNINLDATAPNCEFFYKKEDGSYVKIDEFLNQKNNFLHIEALDFVIYGFVPAIKTVVTDNDSGLVVESYNQENPMAYYATGIFDDIHEFINNYGEIPPVTSAEFYNLSWCPMTLDLKKAEHVIKFKKRDSLEDFVSGEYDLIISKDWDYYEEYVLDLVGNRLSGNARIENIKIDFYAPTISEIAISDIGEASFSVLDDYSGLENDYSKIKYAWIKESTIPNDVEWKTITKEQLKQSIKNSTTNNIGEYKIDVGTPEDDEEYYLAVKLDNLKDIAGNIADITKVSTKKARKENFEFTLENLEYTLTNVDGDNQNGFVLGKDTWGKSVNVDIVLTASGEKGLNKGTYTFEYYWTTDENYNWDTPKNQLGRTGIYVNTDGIHSANKTITIKDYTGKGYLYVRPTDQYVSGGGTKIDITPKRIQVNLDNKAPEIEVFYEDENGQERSIEEFIENDDAFFRFSNYESFQYQATIPRMSYVFSDNETGLMSNDINKFWSWHIFFKSGENPKNITETYQNPDYKGSAWFLSSIPLNDTHSIVKDDIFIEYKNNFVYYPSNIPSGEYYFSAKAKIGNVLNSDKFLLDNCGNGTEDIYSVGPIKIDTKAPEIKGIFRDDFDNAQILLTDDYSGLTNDYSKIKYAWVENKEDTPTVWNTVKSSNVTIKNYTAYNKPSELNIKADMPNEAGNWYLAVKIEGYEDIAGNKAGSDIKFSDDTYGLATDLQIEVFEEPGLEQIKEVKIKITSETGKLFKIKSISYEHKGLNDKQEIITGDLEVTREYISNYHSTVNGPIIVTVEGINGQFYTKEYIVKNVQGLILNYDISETEFWLPIWSSNIDDEHLIYVDWNKLSNEHEGSYVVNNLFDVNTIEVEVEKTIDDEIVYEIEERSELTFNSENVAIHNYNSPGKKQIEITGVFADIDYNNDYGALNDESFNGKYYTEDSKNRIHEFYQKIETSRNSLKEIVQFGWQIGGINNEYCKKTNAITNFYCCKNLTTIPEVESEEAVETDINVRVFKELTSMDRTFYGSGITKFDHKFLYKSNNLSSMTSTFEKCENLTYFHKDALKNCGNLKNFIGVFCESSLSSITDEEGLLTDEEGFISGDFFANNDLLMNVSTAFKLTKIKKIDSNLFEKNPKLQYVNGTFEGSLLEEIPSTLFATNEQLLQANDTFEGTKIFDDPENPEHVGIPEELFYNNPDLEQVCDTFRNTSISVIPKDLFKFNESLYKANGTFAETKVASIPKSLFENNIYLGYANETFKNTLVNSIPVELFALNTFLKEVIAVFENTLIEYIPSDIFIANSNLDNVSYAFKNTKITLIPETIFTNNKAIQYLNGTFSYTLVSEISNEIFLPVQGSAKEFKYLFQGCEDLKIENNENLFKDFSQVISFYGVFESCKSLDVIPNNLFSGCSAVEDLSYALSTTAIEKVERNVIFGNDVACKENTIKTRGMFAWCFQLAKVDNLFEGFSNLEDVSWMFAQCWGLKKVNSSIYEECENIQFLKGTFFDCSNLTELGYNAFDAFMFNSNPKLLSNSLAPQTKIENGIKYERIVWVGIFQNCRKLTREQTPPIYDYVPFRVVCKDGTSFTNYNAYYQLGADVGFELTCEGSEHYEGEWEVVDE